MAGRPPRGDRLRTTGATCSADLVGMTGSTAPALMLLIAAVGGILFTLILGSARILQLRRAVRARRR